MLSNDQKRQLSAVHNELDFYIRAAEGEGYAASIADDPKALDELVKLERGMERELGRYFKDMAANRVTQLVNWPEFNQRAQPKTAEELIIEVNSRVVLEEQQLILRVVYDFILNGQGIGIRGASRAYNMPVNEVDFAGAVQRAARRHGLNLAKNINATTRAAIRNSLEASLSLGENVDLATKRLANVITNPARATAIARSEATNAWGSGTNLFGKQTGAKGKVWDSVIDKRTSPICIELQSKYGDPSRAIKVNASFISSYVGAISSPGAHTNCRSGMYLLYE